MESPDINGEEDEEQKEEAFGLKNDSELKGSKAHLSLISTPNPQENSPLFTIA